MFLKNQKYHQFLYFRLFQKYLMFQMSPMNQNKYHQIQMFLKNQKYHQNPKFLSYHYYHYYHYYHLCHQNQKFQTYHLYQKFHLNLKYHPYQ
jgi:hypothetical protein